MFSLLEEDATMRCEKGGGEAGENARGEKGGVHKKGRKKINEER
jgi:hypothetical protein